MKPRAPDAPDFAAAQVRVIALTGVVENHIEDRRRPPQFSVCQRLCLGKNHGE
jgi:hypothetical protein